MILAANLVLAHASAAPPRVLSVVGRWYRSPDGGRTDETLQLEAKGAATYTRAMGKRLVKSYGTWRRSGSSALVVKLPIKDLRKNDEKGFILRVEPGRLVPREGEAWVRARRVSVTAPLVGTYNGLVRRTGNDDFLKLDLRPGGAATLVRSPRGGTSEEIEGRWEERGGEVLLSFEDATETRFVREGTSLQARGQDRRLFGDAPIRLLRSPKG